MRAFAKVFVSGALACILCSSYSLASPVEEKIAGFYMSRKPYTSSIINSETTLQNELALMFHADGTVTRDDAGAYDLWGLQGQGNGGLFFSQPINGVWEVVHKKGKTAIVHAVLFQYAPATDYPPPSEGMPAFFAPNPEAVIVRRCWAYKFCDLKNGKFQKCIGLKSAPKFILPNQDPLSTEIHQDSVQPGAPSGPLPVFSRVKVQKIWFKNFKPK